MFKHTFENPPMLSFSNQIGDPMKILHWAFPHQPGRGGQAIFIERLSIEFAQKGHSVGIMVGAEADQFEMKRILGDNIEIFPLKIAVGDLRRENTAQFFRVANIIDGFNPDVIHIHNLESPEIVYLRFFQNTKGKNLPVICTLHDLVSLKRLKNSISGGNELNGNTTIVSPSKYFASQFDSLFPDQESKFKMIYHGVPPIYVWKKDVSEHPRILFAADLHEHKGGIFLINAWEKIYRKFPNVILTIAGEGKARDFLEQYVKSANFYNQVEFVGWLAQNELQSLLTNECIFVMPSMLEEAFGLIAAEAAMSGAAMIVNRVGALPEIIEDGISGLVVTPGDSPELAHAIEKLLLHRELRVKFGLAAKKRAEELFTLKKSVNEYEILYSEVTKQI